MEEFIDGLNELKKKIFFDMLAMAGRVFILIQYSEDVRIGTRGFIGDEPEKGLILVFNDKMRFSWDNGVIEAKLSFNNAPQKCRIPVSNIVTIYSPELQSQFTCAYQGMSTGEPDDNEVDTEDIENSKVVKVDFSKKRR